MNGPGSESSAGEARRTVVVNDSTEKLPSAEHRLVRVKLRSALGGGSRLPRSQVVNGNPYKFPFSLYESPVPLANKRYLAWRPGTDNMLCTWPRVQPGMPIICNKGDARRQQVENREQWLVRGETERKIERKERGAPKEEDAAVPKGSV